MRSILGKCDETVVTEINKADDQAAMGQTIATDTLTAIASESASPLQTGDQRPRFDAPSGALSQATSRPPVPLRHGAGPANIMSPRRSGVSQVDVAS